MRTHEKNMTKLAHLFTTDVEDCAGWIEDLLREITGEDDLTFEFDQLGDCMHEHQIDEIAEALIEHYNKEHELNLQEIRSLVFFLRTH